MMSESFRTPAGHDGASTDATEAFSAYVARCMRGMKDCAEQWRFRHDPLDIYSTYTPLPKRGEDPWLDACMERVCR